ncbi:hypothetical protein FACS1894199_04650 [Bacteroidia bacterium]|nr:hypothetical protein FACS1894199_04650 [Bacteroidia bacterium]
MKNQYVGDVNDFLKFTLIETISDALDYKKIFIAWMLTKNDGDGMVLGYLNENGNDAFNKPFFDEFHKMINEWKEYRKEDPRKIERIQNTFERKYGKGKYLFHSESIDSESIDKKPRGRYFEELSRIAKNSDIDFVFFDPDNGIKVENNDKGQLSFSSEATNKSPKHLYWDEIETFWNMGKDLLIYQHLGRPKGGVDQYISEIVKQITDNIKKNKNITNGYVIPIRTKRTVFFYITQHEAAKEKLQKKLEEKPEYGEKWKEELFIQL